MSHFLFGEFDTKQKIELEKEIYTNRDFFYWFNQQVDFCDDVIKMMGENQKSKKENWFLITSKLQMKNSEDILFPYDKYSNEELFPEGEDRRYFEESCSQNLHLLSESLEQFVKDMQPTYLRIFVTEGYDNAFELEECTINMMIEDLQKQIINSFSIASKIYDIDPSRHKGASECYKTR